MEVAAVALWPPACCPSCGCPRTVAALSRSVVEAVVVGILCGDGGGGLAVGGDGVDEVGGWTWHDVVAVVAVAVAAQT